MSKPSMIPRCYFEYGTNVGIHDAVESMTAAMTLVLADDCGMGEERLIKTIRRFNEVFDSVNEKESRYKISLIR